MENSAKSSSSEPQKVHESATASYEKKPAEYAHTAPTTSSTVLPPFSTQSQHVHQPSVVTPQQPYEQVPVKTEESLPKIHSADQPKLPGAVLPLASGNENDAPAHILQNQQTHHYQPREQHAQQADQPQQPNLRQHQPQDLHQNQGQPIMPLSGRSPSRDDPNRVMLPSINKVYPKFDEEGGFASAGQTLPLVRDSEKNEDLPFIIPHHHQQPQHMPQPSEQQHVHSSAQTPIVPQQHQQEPYVQPLQQQSHPQSHTSQQPASHGGPQQVVYMPVYSYNQQFPGQQLSYMGQTTSTPSVPQPQQPQPQPQQPQPQQPQPQQPQPQQLPQPQQQSQRPQPAQQPMHQVPPASQSAPQVQPLNLSQAFSGSHSTSSLSYHGGGMNVKDALSYLEQVKKQFNTQPDVYNHFLDIMKDFKSESIDTPGVIDRVSSLFRGHNNLIQGFNAFLPEGFRIICSSDPSDPNPVTVVTPSGSHVLQQMAPLQQVPQQQVDSNASSGHASVRESPSQHHQQIRSHSQSPQPQTGPLASVQHQVHQAQQMHYHRQQINANAHLHVARQHSPIPGSYGYSQVSGSSESQPQASQQPQQATAPGAQQDGLSSAERQNGPVEFNHAINYVNKIKTHFSSQPDVYKQFLEILQTYQREQMRIPDVYAQVRRLFKDAPDLLEGFKTFLPDTSQDANMDVQLPPVGSFGPSQPVVSSVQLQHPMSSQTMSGSPTGVPMVVDNISGMPQLQQQPQQSHSQSQQQQQQQQGSVGNAITAMNGAVANAVPLNVNMASSSSAPHLSTQQPLTHVSNAVQSGGIQPPLSSIRGSPRRSNGTGDLFVPPVKSSAYSRDSLSNDVAFFDKVKKTLSKVTYHEFLKVLNLFTQQIIDIPQLVEEVEPFLSPTPDLFDWFKKFVGYDGKPLHIENITFRKHLIDLSQCRSYGRSYRLLPKTERYMPCSGRDELGKEVFNDEWVGYPIWASEDSGFVAHRKNQYEEIMFRVEEERHEYDHWIGACERTIQVLEVIANRLASMGPAELAVLKLPEGLGHGTKIYQKVIRKIYDKKNGEEVIRALHENPAAAVPVVLRRLKQKDEEWRRAQREWKKIWREAERKAYYKSLDHVGLTFKQADRKQLTPRALLAEIMTVKAEQGAKRKLAATNLQPTPIPQSHLDYTVTDYAVIDDLKDLILKYIDHRHTMSIHDKALCKEFLGLFIDEFFTQGPISSKNIEKLVSSQNNSETADGEDGKEEADNEEADAEMEDGTNGAEADSATHSAADADGDAKMNEDGSADAENNKESSAEPVPSSSWLKVDHTTPPLAAAPVKRTRYNLFGSTPIYLFLRIFQTIYSRLVEVKGYEEIVSSTLANSRRTPFAVELGLYDSRLENMGLQFSPESPYKQTLALCYRLIEDDLEVQWFEEALRQAYRNRAYKLYTIDKALQSLVKQLHAVVTDPASINALLLWENDRTSDETSVKKQIELRMRAKQAISGVGLSSDSYGAAESSEPLFRIAWAPESHQMSFQYIGPFDITLKGEMDDQQQWDYYVTSYTMSLPTEGVPLDLIRAPVLQRTVPTDGSGYQFEVLLENLVARIAYGSYKLVFEPETADYIINIPPTQGDDKRCKELRSARWKEILGSAEEALKEAEAEAISEQKQEAATSAGNSAVVSVQTPSTNDTEKPSTDGETVKSDVTPAMLAAQPRLEMQPVKLVLPKSQ